MAVLLVRHASAGDRYRWDGRDEDRPLDEQGRGEAEGLIETLAGFAVAQILSSPYVRCVQTVEPLAAVRGLTVEATDDLAEGSGPAALRLVRDRAQEAGSDAVLCTHGDIVEEVLDALGVHRSGETEKGATWVLGPGPARRLPVPRRA